MNKDFIFLILLLVIVFGVLFWQSPDTIDFYFDKIKAGISPKLELSENPGLDFSENNIESLFEEEELSFAPEVATADEYGIGGPLFGELLEGQVVEKEVVILEKKLTLEEIEQEVDRITKEVERIDKEVQTLVSSGKTKNG